MKELVVCVCIGLSLSIPTGVLGQYSQFAYAKVDDQFTSNVMLNEISPRAFRHFKRFYGSVSDENWIRTRTGFAVVFFDCDSSQYCMSFDTKGRFRNTYIYYRKHFPEYVSRVMKSYSKGFDIYLVDGVDNGLKTTYQVALANNKMVRVYELAGDGGISLICQYENITGRH